MHRNGHRRLVVTSLAAVALAAAVLLPIGTEVTEGQPAPTATATGSPPADVCTVQTQKIAQPSTVMLGESVDVTLTAQISCPATAFALDLVLVLDGSGSMAGEPLRLMKSTASDVVRGLEMGTHPRIRIAIVEYNTTTRMLTGLTNDESRVLAAIDRIVPRGGTRMDAGIQMGIRALRHPGAQSSADKCVPNVMVVLSDGGNNAGCATPQQAARQAMGRGIGVVSIALGAGADQQCLRSLASSPDYYHYAPVATDLQAVFGAVLAQLLVLAQRSGLDQLTVIDRLSPDVDFVPGSVSSPGSLGPGRAVKWSWTNPPATELTMTLKVTPTRTGRVPTNVGAVGTITSCLGHETVFTFPVPVVDVVGPATAAPPPTNTSLPTASPTETTTPTATPTAVATTVPGPTSCYLPAVARNTVGICSGQQVEVAYVIDVSPSMLESTGSGAATKLDEARTALTAFTTQIEPADGHAVAVVTFDDSAHLVHPLSTDLGDLAATIALVAAGSGNSRLDLGLGTALDAVTGPDHLDGRSPMLVVLTDGRAEPPYAQAAIAQADQARGSGVRVYAVGLGADPDRQTLREVAGTPRRMSIAAGSSELLRAFRAVWDDMRCP